VRPAAPLLLRPRPSPRNAHQKPLRLTRAPTHRQAAARLEPMPCRQPWRSGVQRLADGCAPTAVLQRASGGAAWRILRPMRLGHSAPARSRPDERLPGRRLHPRRTCRDFAAQREGDGEVMKRCCGEAGCSSMRRGGSAVLAARRRCQRLRIAGASGEPPSRVSTSCATRTSGPSFPTTLSPLQPVHAPSSLTHRLARCTSLGTPAHAPMPPHASS